MPYRVRRISLSICLLITSIVMISPVVIAQENDELIGKWLGDLAVPGAYIEFGITFSRADDGTIVGTVELQGVSGLPLGDLQLGAGTFHGIVNDPDGEIIIDGALDVKTRILKGEAEQGGAKFPFELNYGKRKEREAVVSENMISPEHLAEAWQRIADYTIELAEKMPEEYYDWTPVEGLRTFGEQMNHITGSNYFFASAIFGYPNPMQDAPEPPRTKEDIIKNLTDSFAHMKKGIESTEAQEWREILAGGKTRFETFLFGNDHVTHTRAIALMYLRIKGMAPPQYRTF